MRSHSPRPPSAEAARVTEDVRMASDELLGQGLHDVTEVEGALLLRHAGVEHDLEQEVAQFVTQVVEVAAHDGVDNLVGLLDGVGGDGREALLESHGQPVPGVRSVAMMSMSRAMSRDGVMGQTCRDGATVEAWGAGRATGGHKLRCLAAPCPAALAHETRMAGTRPGHPQQRRVVSRFRRSHHCAARSFANFGIEGGH